MLTYHQRHLICLIGEKEGNIIIRISFGVNDRVIGRIYLNLTVFFLSFLRIGGKSRNMGSVEITPVNGDASGIVDPNASALEQARAMERHFNAMDMELQKAGLTKSLKVSPINISTPTMLSPSAGRANSPTHTPPSASSVTPPASATSPPPKAGSKLEAIFGGKRKV